MLEHIVETENLCKIYKVGQEDVPILKNIDLSIAKGEFVSIMGPSGCGKSTLLYLLGGIDEPTSGRVLIEQQDLHQLSDQKKSSIRRSFIGFVFQFYNLVHNLTVEENIMLPLIMDGKKAANYQRQLDETLEIVGLADRKKFTPRELSGGQQQRVAIARSLIINPKLILADEPIGNLDSKTGTNIMELFYRINKEKGVTIIQVTHSNEAAQYGDRIIRMKDGTLV
ncbi:ABC transporter ATP-binding protein [Siminovitchia sp. FSL H7-0308]|uniref:ABC transport system ATP-binding protein n=1 Tax=Siminovitchia thermophila TaxID=1245522 RepID=A0ABS2R3C6_9BACI|nr:ABC transporter ATP-binding protein [Siminovitchia thermophila]MBM7713659.1 putative ABC transport system ATP-binding protein [Siminovitchia thermophila]ONK21876.1 macrolide ABC transporter ATP-binding protein [Bacillus sp. VT-16-64]